MPLWHPPEGGFAGGFVRARRILELQKTLDCILVDTDTTDIEDGSIRGTVVRLPLAWLFAKRGVAFGVMRALNWFAYCVATTAYGLLWRGRIDAVYVPCSEIVVSSLSGWIVARARGVPLILVNLNVRGVPLWSLNRRLHARADLVLTISHALEKELRDEGLHDPIELVAVGVDDASVPRRNIEYDAVFVGRHTAEKGIYDLLDIWQRCCRDNPALRLAMIGPCSEDTRLDLITKMRQAGIEERVALLGPISEAAKWEAYASSRLCLFPSRVEGWGIVPVEANLAAIPVVAYDLPAYEENIHRSPAAYLFKEGDVQGMAGCVSRLLREPFVENDAARTWARQFAWGTAAAREERLTLEAIARYQK